jgi:hypothetical protein
VLTLLVVGPQSASLPTDLVPSFPFKQVFGVHSVVNHAHIPDPYHAATAKHSFH